MKFSKRLRKSNKHARNILVLGTAFGNIIELTESFDTVFVIADHSQRIQKRNIVYRENFDGIHLLTDVDFIIVDLDQQQHITELTQVWRRSHPAIIIQGPELVDKHYQKILKADHYEIKEVNKNYYVYKNKK